MKNVIFGERFFTREETEDDAYDVAKAFVGEERAIWLLTNIFMRTIICMSIIVATPITIAIRVLATLIKAVLKSFAIVVQETGSTLNFITNPIAFKYMNQKDERL